jgi:hypothetical protein
MGSSEGHHVVREPATVVPEVEELTTNVRTKPKVGAISSRKVEGPARRQDNAASRKRALPRLR